MINKVKKVNSKNSVEYNDVDLKKYLNNTELLLDTMLSENSLVNLIYLEALFLRNISDIISITKVLDDVDEVKMIKERLNKLIIPFIKYLDMPLRSNSSLDKYVFSELFLKLNRLIVEKQINLSLSDDSIDDSNDNILKLVNKIKELNNGININDKRNTINIKNDELDNVNKNIKAHIIYILLGFLKKDKINDINSILDEYYLDENKSETIKIDVSNNLNYTKIVIDLTNILLKNHIFDLINNVMKNLSYQETKKNINDLMKKVFQYNKEIKESDFIYDFMNYYNNKKYLNNGDSYFYDFILNEKDNYFFNKLYVQDLYNLIKLNMSYEYAKKFDGCNKLLIKNILIDKGKSLTEIMYDDKTIFNKVISVMLQDDKENMLIDEYKHILKNNKEFLLNNNCLNQSNIKNLELYFYSNGFILSKFSQVLSMIRNFNKKVLNVFKNNDVKGIECNDVKFNTKENLLLTNNIEIDSKYIYKDNENKIKEIKEILLLLKEAVEENDNILSSEDNIFIKNGCEIHLDNILSNFNKMVKYGNIKDSNVSLSNNLDDLKNNLLVCKNEIYKHYVDENSSVIYAIKKNKFLL